MKGGTFTVCVRVCVCVCARAEGVGRCDGTLPVK